MGKAPGKSHRKGLALLQVAEMFSTEEDETCLGGQEKNKHESIPYLVRED